MRVCFFGTYNRSHSANLIYAAAVRAAGYELVELHEPVWEKTRDKGSAYFGPLGLLAGGLRWLAAAARLSWRWLTGGGAPVVLVGFNGQLDIVLLRLLAPRHGPHVVFAPLVSVTETLVEDRGVYRYGSPGARFLAALDRLTCRLADVVVADTQEHRRYFIDVLGFEPARVAVSHLGVDNRAFRAELPLPSRRDLADGDEPLEVLYFGQYQPLHGLEVVTDAVGRLSRRGDLRFVFIGTGEDRPRIEAELRATRAAVEFIDWVAYDRLGARIAEADIVLGVFGSSAKAKMVIANKVYEAAALGKAVVNADYAAVREVFEHDRDIVLCEPDGASLAGAIGRLADDEGLRRRVGGGAHAVMRERFRDASQGRVWAGLLGAGDAPALAAGAPPVGVAILNFNGAQETARCLASLGACDYPDLRVLVVDNASSDADRASLEAAVAAHAGVELEVMGENLGYAGGNNLAMGRLFERGCEYVLVLNNDTLVTPEAIDALVRCARAHPEAGPIGPRVTKDWPGARAASLGERCWAPLAWFPRTLLRYRRPRQRSYPVSGVLGCALLVSRRLYDRVGGFDEDYFAYYEETDLCLRAARAGMRSRVEPAAEIAHAGHRGFGSGLSRVAAYLKARNLWCMGSKRLGAAGWLLFVPGYFAMILTSMLGYALRGQLAIVTAMMAGVSAGLAGDGGRPPQKLFDDDGHGPAMSTTAPGGTRT